MEEITTGAELPFQFSFSSHSHVLNVLSVHHIILGCNKVVFVYYDAVHIDAIGKCVEV